MKKQLFFSVPSHNYIGLPKSISKKLRNYKSNTLETLTKASIFAVTFFYSLFLSAQQADGSPTITITDDQGNETVLIDCNYPLNNCTAPLEGNRCLNLNANHTAVNETTTYEVSAINYKNPIEGLTETSLIKLNEDDIWSEMLDLPFEFCFFDETYSTFAVGDNGVITFNQITDKNKCLFTKAAIPNGNVQTNAIFGVFHDLVNGGSNGGCANNKDCGKIKLYVTGEKPKRKFIISYEDLIHFNCENTRSTSQIVLYETSNVIEVYVEKKPTNCEVILPTDSDEVKAQKEIRQHALIGIQDKLGKNAYTPAERNTGKWEITTSEAWRFKPNGESVTTVKWYNENNEHLKDGETITVEVTKPTHYIAKVTYDVCIGDPIIIEDKITIDIDKQFPIANDVDTVICDRGPQGETVNLNDYITDIIEDQTLDLTFYSDKAHTAEILLPENHFILQGSQTIYVKVLRGTQCFDTSELKITLTSEGTSKINEIAICDAGNDNSEEINLPDYNNVIIGNQSGINITYHKTKEDAENDIVANNKITVSNGDSIFIKLTIGKDKGCPNIIELPFKLNEKPKDYELVKEFCDHVLVYDLTQHEQEIIDANNTINTTNFKFSYHKTKNDATKGINPIGDGTGKSDDKESYPVKPNVETHIYIRVENTVSVNDTEETLCFGVVKLILRPKKGVPIGDDEIIQTKNPFNLTQALLEMLKNANIDPNEVEWIFYECDNPDVIITNPDDYPAEDLKDKVCVKVIHKTSKCESNSEIEITILGGGGGGGGGLGGCDTGNDDKETITLSSYDKEIIARTNFDRKDLLKVKYYKTKEDAENNVEPSETEVTLDKNINNGIATFFVRISAIHKNEEVVFWVEEITITLNNITILEPIDDTLVCVPHDAKNNRAIIDLTEITKGSDHIYFDGNKEIKNPKNYTLSVNEKTISYQVPDASGCNSLGEFTLKLERVIANKAELSKCDYEDKIFNLNDALVTINKDFADYSILFFTEKDLAIAGNTTDAITNITNYEIDNGNPTQTIFVRLTSKNECFGITELKLTIYKAPKYNDNTTMELCDFENDNEEVFDLTTFNTQLIHKDNPKAVIKYYTDKNRTEEVTTVTLNETTVIYTTLTDSGECITKNEISFKLNKTPEVRELAIEVCDNLFDDTENYNLLQHELDLVGDSFVYYRGLDNGKPTGYIDAPASYKFAIDATKEQTIYVQTKYDETGCFSYSKLNFKFIEPVVFEDIEMTTCDTFGDGSEIFDITLEDTLGYKAHYYSNENAAILKDDAFKIDPTAVDSAINGTVYIRREHESNGCFSLSLVNLKLIGVPKLNSIEHELCDPNLDGTFEINLTSLNPNVIGDTSGLDFSYYNTEKDANTNNNPIKNHEIYTVPKFDKTIYIRVANQLTGCHAVAAATLKERLRVSVKDVTEVLIECDNDNDGYTLFNLENLSTTLFTDEIGATFNYYNTLKEAKNEENPIANPNSHKNTTPLTQKIYVRVHVEGKCDDITSFNIETISITPNLQDVKFCDGDTATLDAGEGYSSYLWSTGETTQKIKVSEGGDYSITLTNSFGCSGTFNVNATKIELPQVKNSTQVACDDNVIDGSVTFNLKNIIPEVTNNLPVGTVTFYTDSSLSNEITTVETFKNTSNPQTIYIKVFDQNQLCYNTAEFSLRVSSAQLNPAKLEVCDAIETEDGIALFNLKDADKQVLEGIPVITEVTYFETKQDAESNINKLPTDYTNTKPYNQTIYSRIVNEDNCVSIGEVQLIVNKLPQIEDEEAWYCLNTYPKTITLSANVNEGKSTYYTYKWNTGATTPTIQINKAGTYWVEVTTNKGCKKTKTIEVFPSDIAKIEKITIADKSSIGTITIYATGISEYDYSLDNIDYQDSNVFTNVEAGVYTAYVRDKKGGCGIVEQIVAVLGFPSFFTPNNDSYNDTWLPLGFAPSIQLDMKVHIFDRYGKFLAEVDPNTGWDGTFKGNPLPSTDYWYVATYTESFSGVPREFRGHFALRR